MTLALDCETPKRNRAFQLYLKHVEYQMKEFGGDVDFVAAHQFAKHAVDCFETFHTYEETDDRIRSFGRSLQQSA